SCKRRPSSTTHNDTCHNAAHLPHRCHSNEVSGVNGSPEFSEFGSSNKSEDQSDKEINKGNNAQSLRPTLLHDNKRVRPTKLSRSTKEFKQRKDVLPDECQHGLRTRPSPYASLSYPLKKGRGFHLSCSVFLLRHRLGQLDQFR